jgi:cysteine desulfurase
VNYYLDNAATTPMRPEVWEAMGPFASDNFGNSSGVHATSRRAKNALEEARERVAALIGAQPMEIVFTSGGTESDNLAIKGPVLNTSSVDGVVTVATEHEAVLESAHHLERSGHPLTVAGVDPDGLADLAKLVGAVSDSTAVVSVMMVNNETGVIQDIKEIAQRVKSHHPAVCMHSDAVQAYASRRIDVEDLGVDLLTITGHKFGGPKGAGFLYVREGVAIEPVLHGGGQELGRRSGTHDVAGAVGLATAMEVAADDRERFNSEIAKIRDVFEQRLIDAIEGLSINGDLERRSPNHCNVRIPGVRNETLLMRLDRAGVAASAGSACQSGAATVSHVLEGMGLSPDEARECLRFSFGWASTLDEAEDAASIVAGLVESLR